ncbi:MAG TPA: IS1595 family transposase [Candidatus Binatia bacterium]|jgi:transposase-like protein
MDFKAIRKLTEDGAREYLESLRWPEGVKCVHCGASVVAKLAGKATRPGVYKCKTSGCRKQFTVTVGTIFERSHIPLKTWLEAFALVCASKKGISALQLQRMLGLGSYQSAWHMAHRIRHVMEGGGDVFGGPGQDVMLDETWVGPKPGNLHRNKRPGNKGANLYKTPVVALIEKGGRAFAMPVAAVTRANVEAIISKRVSRKSRLLTDDANRYQRLGRQFEGGHETVNHGDGEYVRGTGADTISTNEIEAFFALLKRGVVGSFHHVSKAHLHRYCNEFSFRWSHRKITDAERTRIALTQMVGRRLTYQQPLRRERKSVVA